jgi:hypothetical protein
MIRIFVGVALVLSATAIAIATCQKSDTHACAIPDHCIGHTPCLGTRGFDVANITTCTTFFIGGPSWEKCEDDDEQSPCKSWGWCEEGQGGCIGPSTYDVQPTDTDRFVTTQHPDLSSEMCPENSPSMADGNDDVNKVASGAPPQP